MPGRSANKRRNRLYVRQSTSSSTREPMTTSSRTENAPRSTPVIITRRFLLAIRASNRHHQHIVQRTVLSQGATTMKAYLGTLTLLAVFGVATVGIGADEKKPPEQKAKDNTPPEG